MAEVHLERGHATIEVFPPGSNWEALPRLQLERGPVRLVVTMPVRVVTRELAALGLGIGVVAIAALVTVFRFVDVWPLLILPLSLSLACVAGLVRPIVVERLEIDSRFVTLSRSGRSVAWGRHQFSNPRLIDPAAGAIATSRWFRGVKPTIGWGEYESDADLFSTYIGSGLTRSEAARVLGLVLDFCRDNPADPAFTFGGPVTL